jgi:hypothetical protein
MCGIAGYFSARPPRKAAKAALRILAKEMEYRGPHSWGCTDGETIRRELGQISKSFRPPKFLPANFVLHTRFATTGKVKESNSHPFVVQGKHTVIGVHNGIISNHEELNTKYNREYRVDSQHIFGHLANELPLDDLDGYGTIVYTLDGDWFIGSFNGGDLEAVLTNDGIYFASTYTALRASLVGTHLWKDAKRFTLKQNKVYRLVQEETLGFREEFDVNIGETYQRWDDYDTEYNVWRGGTNSSYRTKSSVSFPYGMCDECGEPLPEGAYPLYSICDECATEASQYLLEEGNDEPNDAKAPPAGWELEVVPEGLENLRCNFCGFSITEFEEFALGADQRVMCVDCLRAYEGDNAKRKGKKRKAWQTEYAKFLEEKWGTDPRVQDKKLQAQKEEEDELHEQYLSELDR